MLDAEQCWHAVCARDVAHDGHFVFAVRSTGIYCRPNCPARRPTRDKVSFYADATAATEAGFRPCKRCSPQGQSPAEQLDKLVIAACQLLTDPEQRLTLSQLAARIGVSASHLVRAFKVRTGMTPRAWSATQRLAKLEQQLPTANTVLDAALMAGYTSTRELYHQPTALSPARRRKQGAGEHLRYSIAPCPLGLILLASSDKGVCAVLLGDEPAVLQAELQQRFAAATLVQDDLGLGEWLHRVVAQLDEPQRAAHLPLDMRGTAFQQQVWRALQQIPAGQTRSYAELAAQLDSHPRAVAGACASNPLGLLVPCHRVIASNGSLSGYRWGLARKAALLEAEAAAAARAPAQVDK